MKETPPDEISIFSLDEKRPLSEQLRARLHCAARLILQEHNLEQGEVNIVLAGNRCLQQLNRQYRGKDTPTDVLSFSMIEAGRTGRFALPAEEQLVVGDVYISLDKAEEQAQEAGHSAHREILILAVHGLLHLAGYDHGNRHDYERMRKQEAEYLRLAEQA